MRAPNPKFEAASGEFDRRKKKIKQPGLSIVAQLFGLETNQLINYRANYVSRKRNPATP